MSYSCTSRGNSQDPSSVKKPASNNNPGRDTGGADSSSNGSPKQTAAMKVKKGCNSTDVGVPVTAEEDLLASTVITPEDVLGLQKITESKFTAALSVAESQSREKVPKYYSSSVSHIAITSLPCPLIYVMCTGPIQTHDNASLEPPSLVNVAHILCWHLQ